MPCAQQENICWRIPAAAIQSGDICGPRLPTSCGKAGFPETAE